MQTQNRDRQAQVIKKRQEDEKKTVKSKTNIKECNIKDTVLFSAKRM